MHLCRNRFLASTTCKRRIYSQPNEGSTSEKDGIYSRINQEPLFAAFQGSVKGRYRRLDLASVSCTIYEY